MGLTSRLDDFDRVDKELVKKRLEYREFTAAQQSELLGLSFEDRAHLLSELKAVADSTYRGGDFAEAIEQYLKGLPLSVRATAEAFFFDTLTK